MHLEMSSAKWRPLCLELNVLISKLTLIMRHHNKANIIDDTDDCDRKDKSKNDGNDGGNNK